MSNSEPSAIVLQGIPCMYGLYKFRLEWRKQFAQGSPRFTLSRSRMRSRTVFGHSHYFELGEVVQQDWMKAQARQEKKPIIDSLLPVTAVWRPLESIIQKKATKKYAQQATPLSLLLYAERNAPHWAVIEPLVRQRKHEIRASFENSVFDHLWLFMANENRIPFSLSRKMIVAPPV